jgi:hypothetical protein
MEQEEIVLEETVLREEEIEPFGWEDYLYESWLEERRQQRGKRPDDTGVSV